MRRLIVTAVLGSLLLTGAAGCGPSKGSTTPKETVPFVPGGPDTTGGGQAKGAKGANAPGAGSTAQ
jgi:hypothetical protein